jgi:hypothetical protein
MLFSKSLSNALKDELTVNGLLLPAAFDFFFPRKFRWFQRRFRQYEVYLSYSRDPATWSPCRLCPVVSYS